VFQNIYPSGWFLVETPVMGTHMFKPLHHPIFDDNVIMKFIIRVMAGFTLIFLVASCGTARKTTIGKVDLNRYAGVWFGDDYLRTVNDQGDSVTLGSILTIDPYRSRIHLECHGPPFMSRIADLDTTIFLTGPGKGRFQFEDSWGNAGTGRIEFRDDVITVDIAIDRRAYSDWQIFEGSVSFMR
jgi:hypothetical protein